MVHVFNHLRFLTLGLCYKVLDNLGIVLKHFIFGVKLLGNLIKIDVVGQLVVLQDPVDAVIDYLLDALNLLCVEARMSTLEDCSFFGKLVKLDLDLRF